MRTLLAAAGLASLLLGPAAHAVELKALLDQLAPPAAAKQGKVDVTGWLETSPEGTDLVVTLTPSGVAKLAADPGIVITPLARPDGAIPGDPVELVDPDLGYLTAPPTLRVPLPRHQGGPVEARVDYAYCLVTTQCLFGETVVRIDAPPSGS